MSKEVSDDVKSFIRALLLSSTKGVKQTQFHREYETFTNSKIEWRKMGFNDVYEFLLAIPDVARLEYSKKDGQNLIFGVNRKDIYASSHAKKAGMKGTGEKPRHPSQWEKPANTSPNKNDKQFKKRTVDVSADASSVKVTFSNGEVLAPNEQGLYAVHIKDLPSMFTKEELDMIFKVYPSFRFCKVIQPSTSSKQHPFAFAKFSNQEDAMKAMREKDRYNLRGATIKLSKAIEHMASKQSSNENKNNSNQKSKASPPKNHLVQNSLSAQQKTSSDIISEIELMQLYSRYGMVKNVDVHADRSISLRFSSAEEAVSTVKNMREFSFNGCKLSLSNPQGNCVTVHIDDQKPDQAQNIKFPNKESYPISSASSSLDRSANSSNSKENISNSQGLPTLPHSGKLGLTNSVSQGNYVHQNQQQNKGHLQPKLPQQQLQHQQHQHQQQAQHHHHQQQQTQQHQQQQQTQQHHQQQRLQPPQLQQQQQHQQHQPLQQRPQQNQQQNIQSASNPSPPSAQILEENIHLILSKEDMERLCNASGHPLEEKLKGLPDEIDILVTEVVDACRFWAIIDSKTGNWRQLEQLEEHLQKDSTKNSVVPQRLTLGAAKFTENNVWYRCFVLDVSSDHQHVKVLYLDYGNVEWIPLERFSSLDSIYLSLPPQANAFHLAGLEINYNSSDSLKEGAEYLKDLIGNTTLRAKRKLPVSTNQAHILEVELFTKASPSVSINDTMAATQFVSKIKPIPKSPSSFANAPGITHPSAKSEKFKLRISWVQSASHIFYQKVGSEDSLQKINDLLNNIPSSEKVFPKKGELICYEHKDLTRRRAQILDLTSSAGAITSAKIRCIDYGNCVRDAQTKTMLKLPFVLGSLDPVAKEAYLDTGNHPTLWPKEAYNVIIEHKDKVLDGVITGNNHNRETIELYDAEGECLNKKIVAVTEAIERTPKPLMDTGISKREPGPAPLSPSAVSIVLGNQGLPSLQSAHHNPTTSQPKSDAMSANKRQSHPQGPVSGFYMPPPPLDSKEIQASPQRKPNSSPQGSQINIPQGTQNNLPQGTQNNLPQGTQNNLSQGTQKDIPQLNIPPATQRSHNNLPHGSSSITMSPQELKWIGSKQQALQNVNTSPQGVQALSNQHQTSQALVSQTGLQRPNPPQGSQAAQGSWSPQSAQNLKSPPQGSHVPNVSNTATPVSPDMKAQQPATLRSSIQGTVTNHPNPKTTQTQEVVQNEEWQK